MVPVSRDNAESLPPLPPRSECDRYPDVIAYAPFAPPGLEARLAELNRRSADAAGGAVRPPGCRFHWQPDAAEVRNLLFLPKYAVVVSVSAPADKARTMARLDAALGHAVPRFCSRWLHLDLADFCMGGGDDEKQEEESEEEKAVLAAMGRKIQNCFLHQVVQQDRAVQRPVFSVFTTTYRTGTRIRRAFQSLRRQHLVDWEWVVLDDSPDEGEHFDLLRKELLVGDHRVRLYRRNGNSGSIGEVKNECIGLCRGRFLLELDHDDELTPNCLSDGAAVFQRDPAVGFVYTDFANLYEHTMNPFRYPEGYGLGLAGYYCRHVLSADPAISRAGSEADSAFRAGSTWFSQQYASVTPQVCPVSVTHLVALPNHPRMWRRTTMEHMGSYSEFLPICDDQEILMRTQACGAKIVKLHTVGYLQYMNPPSSGGNFSHIRNQEICRMGSTGPLYKLFQEEHPSVDRLFMAADCDPDMKFRGPQVYYRGWVRDEVPTYYNGLEHPDGDGVVVYLGMAAVVTRGQQFLDDLLGGSSDAEGAEKATTDDAVEDEASSLSTTTTTASSLFRYATPVHGSSMAGSGGDKWSPHPGRRRRRVVYVLSSDMGDMETLQVLTAWMKQVRPKTTQAELCLLRAYGFDLSDPGKRDLFRADWSDEQCLVQYARHLYAADAEFVRPDLPALPSLEEIERAMQQQPTPPALATADTAADQESVAGRLKDVFHRGRHWRLQSDLLTGTHWASTHENGVVTSRHQVDEHGDYVDRNDGRDDATTNPMHHPQKDACCGDDVVSSSSSPPPLKKKLPAAIAALSRRREDGAAAAAAAGVQEEEEEEEMAFGADNALTQILSGKFRIVPVEFDKAAAAAAATRPPIKAVADYSCRTRLEAVRRFVDPLRTHYLEIGVETGGLFNAVRAARKTGVDPALSPFFAVPRAQAERSQVFEVTSDNYFLDPANAAREVHVAFVDGMHLADYVARDVENVSEAIVNTLRRRRRQDDEGKAAEDADTAAAVGWLILDDVVPRDRVEQDRVPRGAYHDRGILKYGAPWTGDVWKAAAALLRKYPGLVRRLFLCPEEYRGVLAIRLTADDEPLRLTSREMAAAMALDFDADFEAYLAELQICE